MRAFGLRRRYGRSGLWRCDHDLGEEDWGLVLPLQRELAIYLHETGMLCRDGDGAAESLQPGIILLDGRIEARLALSRPETAVASAKVCVVDFVDEELPLPLRDLWLSARPEPQTTT